MNKEMEELVLLGVGAFILLSFLNSSSASNAQKTAASLVTAQNVQNATYATDATSVINTAIADFSG